MLDKVQTTDGHLRIPGLLLLGAAMLFASPGRAQEAPGAVILAAVVEQETTPRRTPLTPPGVEKPRTGWAFYVDNDGLVPRDTDRDYTGGFSLTLSGAEAREIPLNLDRWLGGIDRGLGVHGSSDGSARVHSIEWGFTAFTPEDVTASTPLPQDRPYASLVYLSNSRQSLGRRDNSSTITTLTLGIIGLDLAADVQNRLHESVGFETAKGWDHQISDGGEPTARYSMTRQWLLKGEYSAEGLNYEFQTAGKANLGYLTDVSWSLSARWGRLRSPWWTHNPQLTEYGEKVSPVGSGLPGWYRGESYLWGGITLRYRFYNAFLQGQFRDSEVTYASDELRHDLIEVWLGYTHEIGDGFRLSYLLRGQSAEIESGPAARDVIWGGLIISQTL